MIKTFWSLCVLFTIMVNLTGCSTYDELLDKEEPKVIEKEIIKEKIVYIDRNITIKESCNITKPKIINYNYTSSTNRELELIRRIKFLEGQTDKYWNDSECHDTLNNTTKRLKDCEEELCYEWNSSWC